MADIAGIDFQFRMPPGRSRARRLDRGALRVLVMGDFAAREAANRSTAIADRPLLPVDVDNLEQVMVRLAPRVVLSTGADIEIGFSCLEDFHPDALFRRVEAFTALRELRSRLADPASFAQAAAELRDSARGPLPQPPKQTTPAPSAEDDAATLARVLGAKPTGAAPPGGEAPTATVSQMLRSLVAPYIVAEADPHQDLYLAYVDEAITGLMGRILHDPGFQALESLWRALHWLVTGLEADPELHIRLLDATKAELAADLAQSGGNLADSGLYRLLIEHESAALGGQPWGLLVGSYTFGSDAGDVQLLAGLGAIASQAGGPFIAAAHPEVLGCRSLVETPDPRDWQAPSADARARWQALRASPAAPWLGLALPRVLLRLPYGASTDPIESFAFEELSAQRPHEDYLWGNPALACALLIGRAFLDNGWSMQPGDQLDIDDLPAHTFRAEGASRMQPCAEVYLTDHAAQAILAQGVMPLMSYRDRNAVRIMRFQSVADALGPLQGPWA